MASEPEFDFRGDEDYPRHRRQRSIYDTRDLVRDIILTGKQQYRRGDIKLQVAQSDARSAVEMFIMEIEHMAQAVGALDLLEHTHIHTVHVPPPTDLLSYFEDDRHSVRSPEPTPQPAEEGSITGLWGFLTAPDTFHAEWRIDVDVRHKGPRTITKEASTQMPIDASLDAFRHVNQFLKRVGLDLEARLEDYEGDSGPGI